MPRPNDVVRPGNDRQASKLRLVPSVPMILRVSHPAARRFELDVRCACGLEAVAEVSTEYKAVTFFCDCGRSLRFAWTFCFFRDDGVVWSVQAWMPCGHPLGDIGRMCSGVWY